MLQMFRNDSDRDWEAWGKENPYYGVYRDPQFLETSLNETALETFFASGRDHNERVFRTIGDKIRPAFAPRNALDYGCGVGRVALDLSHRAEAVVGVDVSASMLAEARRNSEAQGVVNARFVHTDDMASLPAASFDFVHCYIVFQHIPPAKGEAIMRQLLGLLAPGGIGALQFTYSDARRGSRVALRRAVSRLREQVSVAHGLINLIQRRPFRSPLMQMNIYSLNRLFDILLEAGCHDINVEFSDHGGYHGAMLYFEKASKSFL